MIGLSPSGVLVLLDKVAGMYTRGALLQLVRARGMTVIL